MLTEVLPETDVFVSPTFQEAFGFAILEASAYGIPVISTHHFAIPEIIANEKSGFLIPTQQFSFIRNGKVCVLNNIPEDFHNYLTEEVYKHMKFFIENPLEIPKMGQHGIEIAKTKFSFEQRNRKMLNIYKKGVNQFQNI